MTEKRNSGVPFISVCIPAYKKPEKIRRLLNSVAVQEYADYEIIISDDSGDDSVEKVIADFPGLPITYFRNQEALGTPGNWNFAISKARGEWIKIMHDDDWFADKDSLGLFAEQTSRGFPFIFSAYRNIHEDGKVQVPANNRSWIPHVLKNPMLLVSKNIIGPPSVTLIHSGFKEQYDHRMKWRVDQEFYMRLIKKYHSLHFIDKPLIHVGIGASQVTNSCINNPDVELPEGFLMFQKHGTSYLSNIRVYDAWWRIFRNVNVRSVHDLYKHADQSWPEVILKMVKHQTSIHPSLLKTGVLSKTLMVLSYLLNRKNIFKTPLLNSPAHDQA